MHRHSIVKPISQTAARASLHKYNVKEQNRENNKQHVTARGRVIGPPQVGVKPFSEESFYAEKNGLNLPSL
jgi:phage portal protein BeeE